MKTMFSNRQNKKSDVLVLPVLRDGTLATGDKNYQDYADLVTHNIKSDARFDGKTAQTMSFAAPADSGYKKVVLLGLGNKQATKSTFKAAGKALYKALKATGYENADIAAAATKEMKVSEAEAAAILGDSVNAASYSFDKYITDERSAQKKPAQINIVTTHVQCAKAAYTPLAEITKGEFLAADMGNEPANKLYPESAATLIQKEFSNIPGVTVKVIDAEEMEKEGMRSALAVGQGSEKPPCMVVIEYDGTDGQTKDWPLALVGKGVTFDSGGLSIKSGVGMQKMKMDMCGSAAVVGAMRAIAGRGAKAKVVAIAGFAENMPDGKAIRPGDIIKTRSGKTEEILNTDAEGRMVLIDALDYIQDKYKAKTVIDLATLTGATMQALAHVYTAVFTPQDSLWKKLEKAGKESGQEGWRMPLHKVFSDAVKGTYTDLLNLGKIGLAGASTAAAFLQAAIRPKTKWAHLDIAGTAIPADGVAKGYGVRWLDQFVADNYETKPKTEHKSKPRAPEA